MLDLHQERPPLSLREEKKTRTRSQELRHGGMSGGRTSDNSIWRNGRTDNSLWRNGRT